MAVVEFALDQFLVVVVAAAAAEDSQTVVVLVGVLHPVAAERHNWAAGVEKAVVPPAPQEGSDI